MNRTGPQKTDPSALKKILLVRLRRIGDIVMTTPAVRALRLALPEARIAYVVESPYRKLVQGHPDIDDPVVLSPRIGTFGFLRFLWRIRRERYDLVIDFHGGPRASLLTWLSRAELKIGYRIRYRNFMYDTALPRKPERGHFHSVENHLNLVRALGIPVPSALPLCLPEASADEKHRVTSLLEKNVPKGQGFVVLHIGAGNAFRDWGSENILELLRLFERPRVPVALAGGPEDAASEARILKASSGHVFSCVGRLNLRELRELIRRASVYVGPDSGPMHIAASTATPIVALFGPTLPAHFAPWQAEAVLIERDMDCRPCRQKKCVYQDFRCLRSLRPEDVFEACARFLCI
ncbi:MAG: glycosyltransferase family 9 protein [Candidatus Aminicenantales bacterium]